MNTITTRKFTKIMAAVLAAAAITVSAGTTSVSAATDGVAIDSLFLTEIGVSSNKWTNLYTAFNWGEVSKDVDAAWARAGVRAVTNPVSSNEYYIDGRKVTREEAYDYAAKKLGKTYQDI